MCAENNKILEHHFERKDMVELKIYMGNGI